MITVAQKKQLKKVLGNRYSVRVISYLTENKIFNKNGQPFSKGYISHVLNGRNEDLNIESALFFLYEQKIDLHSKINAERNHLLENKKPEAGTSGF